MKITDLMSKEAIKIHGHASSKMDAIEQMVSLIIDRVMSLIKKYIKKQL